DGLEQEIDSTCFVSLEDSRHLPRARRHEDDRDVPGFLDAPHELCQSVSINIGHMYVDDRERDVALEQNLERGAPRAHRDDLDTISAQHPFEGKEVTFNVIDDEYHRAASRRAVHRVPLGLVRGGKPWFPPVVAYVACVLRCCHHFTRKIRSSAARS